MQKIREVNGQENLAIMQAIMKQYTIKEDGKQQSKVWDPRKTQISKGTTTQW